MRVPKPAASTIARLILVCVLEDGAEARAGI
jgi:hypothetical protein